MEKTKIKNAIAFILFYLLSVAIKSVALLKNTGSKGLKISHTESDSLIYSGLQRIITYDESNGILDNILK